ncbi:MAG: hypothetical protein JXR37_19470 [Kiritimatiellae bacterium]|nr:hypothetical protein [Kiritimatiellia bacterium]
MDAVDRLYEQFLKGFGDAAGPVDAMERRIGAELKFPLVNLDGSAVRFETVCALWDYLVERGWRPDDDAVAGRTVGARKPGERNDTVASCETGFCKTEFSLAHVATLHELAESIDRLRAELRPFAEREAVRFLGYGIQPLTRPGKHLLMKKGRTSVWDKVFGANRILPPEDGDDVALFTVNAASHVHINVARDEAVAAVNVLNGFAPAQIALTAHSNIWQGRPDPDYKCVAEKFWDWWMLDASRIGVPEKPFADLKDYVATVAGFRPVYVKRAGKPIVLTRYKTFAEYFGAERAVGEDPDGRDVELVPDPHDADVHATCYWFNARLSHYYTVENRVNDQQPPDALICIAALSLGLVSALPEAGEVLAALDWADLREARDAACRHGLEARLGGGALAGLSARMLDLAETGLARRGLGEAQYLAPLRERLKSGRCPADETAALFEAGGVAALVERRQL